MNVKNRNFGEKFGFRSCMVTFINLLFHSGKTFLHPYGQNWHARYNMAGPGHMVASSDYQSFGSYGRRRRSEQPRRFFCFYEAFYCRIMSGLQDKRVCAGKERSISWVFSQAATDVDNREPSSRA